IFPRGTAVSSAACACPRETPGAAGGGVAGREDAAGAAPEYAGGVAAGAPPAAIIASISCLLIRPPAPVPSTMERLMPCSLAIRRTSGELGIRSPVELEEAEEAVAGVAAGPG